MCCSDARAGSEAGWTCGVSQRMLPSPNGGSLCATRSVPSSSSRSHHCTTQTGGSDWGPEGQPSAPSGSRRAATGVRNNRRVCSETVADHDRRYWHRWPLTWRSSPAFTVLNTTQFHVRRLGTDLAQRKPGVQILTSTHPDDQRQRWSSSCPGSAGRAALGMAGSLTCTGSPCSLVDELEPVGRLEPGQHLLVGRSTRRA
jgi:hypothetical protein